MPNVVETGPYLTSADFYQNRLGHADFSKDTPGYQRLRNLFLRTVAQWDAEQGESFVVTPRT